MTGHSGDKIQRFRAARCASSSSSSTAERVIRQSSWLLVLLLAAAACCPTRVGSLTHSAAAARLVICCGHKPQTKNATRFLWSQATKGLNAMWGLLHQKVSLCHETSHTPNYHRVLNIFSVEFCQQPPPVIGHPPHTFVAVSLPRSSRIRRLTSSFIPLLAACDAQH
jgi:hypothetical protein